MHSRRVSVAPSTHAVNGNGDGPRWPRTCCVDQIQERWKIIMCCASPLLVLGMSPASATTASTSSSAFAPHYGAYLLIYIVDHIKLFPATLLFVINTASRTIVFISNMHGCVNVQIVTRLGMFWTPLSHHADPLCANSKLVKSKIDKRYSSALSSTPRTCPFFTHNNL